MSKIQVWSTGFAATGQSGGAVHHGTVEADNLIEAVIKLAAIEGESFAKHIRVRTYKTKPPVITYWGCRLYDNEQEARKSFG